MLGREQPLAGQSAGADGHGTFVLLVDYIRKVRVVGREHSQNALELVAL